MKNNILTIFSLSLILALQNLQASPNCGHSHPASPDANTTSFSDRIQLSKETLATLKLKHCTVEKRNINEIVQALGVLENIPENTVAISSRVDGSAKEIYVSLAEEVKEGQAILKVESLLAGDPPPSLVLNSPINGIVESLSILRDSPIEASSILATITDTKKLYAKANVFQADFHKLKLGQIASLKIPAMGDETFEAKLVKFSPTASSSTIEVYFELENPSLKLKANMQVFFNIKVDSSEDKVLSVNNTAIGGDYPEHFVFVQECAEDLIYKKVPIAIGRKDDSFSEILLGLNEGEILAKNKIYHLIFSPAAKAEHIHEEESGEHNHTDLEPVAVTHTHCNDEVDDSFGTKVSDYILEKRENIVAFSKSKYFFILIQVAFVISLLLNLLFILAETRKHKSKKESNTKKDTPKEENKA